MRAYYFGELRSGTDPLGETERFRLFRTALEEATRPERPTKRARRKAHERHPARRKSA